VRLLSTGEDGVVSLWNLQLEEVLSIEVGEPLSAATWVTDSQFMVGSIAGTLSVRLSGSEIPNVNP
jgi:hypothetical protein